MDTASDAEPWRSAPRYAAMSFLTRFFGTRPFLPTVMKIMFGPAFLADPARAALRAEMERDLLGEQLVGMRRAVGGVIRRKALASQELARIRAPTLVVSGEQDMGVVPARSRRLFLQIPGAKFVNIPRAGHTSALEEPEAVNHALREFWESLPKA
jgi:pimeloyl-ACP methyl ester carboxylesterase